MSDLASIIIVTHNNWPDLELAIQSALHQSYRPVEVMVVDNASTDATPDMVSRRFGDSVRYLWQSENVLDGGGYNAGFRAARGEFIQFLDADDFLAPDKIEKQVEAFRADPDVDIVRGQFRQFQRSTGSARWSDIDVAEYDEKCETYRKNPADARIHSSTPPVAPGVIQRKRRTFTFGAA